MEKFLMVWDVMKIAVIGLALVIVVIYAIAGLVSGRTELTDKFSAPWEKEERRAERKRLKEARKAFKADAWNK